MFRASPQLLPVLSFLRLLFGALCLMAVVHAQGGRSTFTGVVTDSSNATVPQTEILLTEKATGITTRAYTTSSGSYRVPYLPAGTYCLTAGKLGFKSILKDNVNLSLAQTLTVDFRLEIGEISEQVTVTDAPPLLDSGSLEFGTRASLQELRGWPVIVSGGTRQVHELIFRTMPGAQGDYFQGSINGGQQFSHDVSVDGVSLGRMDFNGRTTIEFTPTMDSVGELEVQSGALSSQYGNTQTAIVNLSLKSGGNRFHGSLFDFYTGSALNANSWNANRLALPKQPQIENNFGATLGGPIARNRTHFFISYEGDQLRNHTTTGNLTVPLAEYKAGDFSRLLDPAFTANPLSGSVIGKDVLGRDVRFGQIYDPATTRLLDDGQWVRDPFPGNRIPGARHSPVTRKILSSHDLPNPMFAKFLSNHPATASGPARRSRNFSVKVDHSLTLTHELTSSVVFNEPTVDFRNVPMLGVEFPGPATDGSQRRQSLGWIVRVSEDWVLSANRLNHLAFGYNRVRGRSVPTVFEERDWAQELGLRGVGGATFPIILFRGNNSTLSGNLATMGAISNTDRPTGSTIVQDDLSVFWRNHSFRLGGEHRRYYLNSRTVQTAGEYDFHHEGTALPGFANQTGFAYSSFLLGALWSANLDLPFVTPGFRSRSSSVYFQDDWKVISRLNLSLGIRWDVAEPPSEVAQRFSSLDPTLPNSGANGRLGALAFLGDCSGCNGKSNFSDTYYGQWAPRLGLAYWLNTKTVVRAGYGINFSPPILNGFSVPYLEGFNGSNPIRSREGRFVEDVRQYWDDPYPSFPLHLPDTNPSLLNGRNIGHYLPESNRMPCVQNWNVSLQRELPWKTKLEASYVGNRGTRLNEWYLSYLNQVNPSYLSLGDTLLDNIDAHPEIPHPYPSFTGTVAQALRPFPQYLTVSTHSLNRGWSNYHALQLTATRRADSGLTVLAAYTFSKALGTGDSAALANDNPQDYYNVAEGYSVTSFHFPHDLKASWVYETPLESKGRLWKRIVGGWLVSGVQRYRSGNPLSLFTSDLNNSQALFSASVRPDVALPRDQQILATPRDPDVDSGAPYLNPAAFISPPRTAKDVPVRLGNAPRYLPNLRGFAYYSEDFSLARRIVLGFREGAALELRMDVINLFNRVQLNNPRTNVSDSFSFGRVFGKSGLPRNIQLGVRVSF